PTCAAPCPTGCGCQFSRPSPGRPRHGGCLSEFADDVRETITFSAAQPGWGALFVEASDETNHFTIPLLGWSLFRITVRDKDTGYLLPRARTQVEGVVLQANSAVGAD